MTKTSDFKKVLIIVHLPRASPRIAGLAKYLPEFNWQPIILTGTTSRYTDLPSRIVQTHYRNALGFLGRIFGLSQESDVAQEGGISSKSLLGFAFSWAGEVINYPCPDKNWRPFAVKAASEILEKENISAIMSSSPPVISHIISNELKTRYKVPWIADLRDLWSQNPNYGYSWVRRALDRRLEIRTLAKADTIATISEPLSEKLRTLHTGRPVHTVVPGFDPADAGGKSYRLSSKFTLTYTGTIYPGKQNPVKLFIALKDLISEGTIESQEIDVRFYGPVLPWLSKDIERYKLSKVAVQHGAVPLAVALEKQRESQVLVLFDWDDPEEKGVYTAKVFEYLGARRPIVAIGGVKGNVVDRLLVETGAGVHAPAVEDIKRALKNMYQEYKSDGKVAYHGDESVLDKYSQRAMTRRFVEILAQLTAATSEQQSR